MPTTLIRILNIICLKTPEGKDQWEINTMITRGEEKSIVIGGGGDVTNKKLVSYLNWN